LQELPGVTLPGDVVDHLVLAVKEAATNAILYGSCDAQAVKVTIRVQGGWIEATIRDRGRPASRTAPVTSLRGRPAMPSTTNRNSSIETVPNGPKRAGRRRRSPVRLVEVAGRAVTDRRPLPLGPG
jgi:Histidine kinase-like ATPase domain